MDDPHPVRGGQRIGNFDRERHRLIEGQWSLPESGRERVSVQVLHHEEVDALVSTDVVQRADVRMGQCRDDLRFPVEARAELRIGGERLRKHLHGDGAIQTRVGRAIDLAHAAGANQVCDAVRAELGAGLQIEGIIEHCGGRFEHRPVDEHRRLVLFEERFDLAPQLVVARALRREKHGAIAGRPIEDRVIESGDLLPAFGVHGQASGRSPSLLFQREQRAVVAHAVPAAEMNWFVPCGNPLSK